MKKIYKILIWILSIVYLLLQLLGTIIFLVFIIVLAFSEQKRIDEHAEWVRTTPQEEKNILLTKEELEKNNRT